MVDANHNPGRHNHRIRTRQAANHPPDWELLQCCLGLAYTIQQEKPRRRARVGATPTSGERPALERIVTFALNLTEATGAALALGDAKAMLCVARSGASAPPIGAEFHLSEGLSGECIRLSQPVICVNAAADPRVNYQACRALNIASMLYLPLYSAKGDPIGVLGVFSSQPLHFSQRDISALRPTERLVQQALAAGADNADVANLRMLLPQADSEAQAIEPSFVAVPASEAAKSQSRQPVIVPKPEKASDAKPTRGEPIFVGRVVDDSVAELDQQQAAEKPRSNKEEAGGRGPIPIMLIVLLLVLVASAAYKYRRVMQRSHAQPKVQEAKPVEASVAPAPVAPAEEAAQKLTDALSIAPTENGAIVTIELSNEIQYEGYQLAHPDRIYFDLHDVRLGEKASEFKNIDGLVSRVRFYTHTTGVTRIVFDLRHPAKFTAKLDEKPARLTIEMRRIGESSTNSEAESRTQLGLHTAANSP